MEKPTTYPEELTAEMHSEFTVSPETDIKHKALTIWDNYANAPEQRQREMCALYGITFEDLLRWKEYALSR